MIFLVLLLLLLSVISGVLSAAETALTAASRAKLHHAEKRGSKRAYIVLALQKNMNQVIATILLANTVVLTSLTALATMLFTDWLGHEGVFYAAALLSALITIYLEVMPKAFVFSRAEKTAMFLAPLVAQLQRLLHPVTRVIGMIAVLSLRLLGARADSLPEESSLDELKGAIDLHKQTHPQERAMLKNILDLTRVTVAEIMIHKGHIFSLNCHLPTSELMKKMLASPFTRIPLWDKDADSIKGLLHVKELYRALQKKTPQELDVISLLKEPWFIPESTTLIQQLQAFRRRREHFAFVVDEYGALAGIVTLEDVLEEIVGDIKDEHDTPLSGITPRGDKCFWVEGTVTLREFNREYNLNLPDSSATTLAGLVMDIAGYIPKENQVFKAHGLTLRVLKRHRNQLKLLEVSVDSLGDETSS